MPGRGTPFQRTERPKGMDDIDDTKDFEAIEAAAWRDVFEGVPRKLAARLGMEVEDVSGVTVLRAPGIDHVLFNRAIGLGTCAVPTDAAVQRIVDGYARAGVGRYFVHVPADCSPDVRARLEGHGLEPFRRAWVKFGRGAEPPGPVRTDVSIVRADARRRSELARIVGSAFDMPEEADAVMASLVGRRGWHVYVALDGDRVVGAGGMFVRDRAASIAFAATSPSHRGRGIQGALMAKRIEVARDLGCERMASETGEAVPGDPQHSYKNMVRHGLRPVYRRDNWCPPGVGWNRAVA